MKRNHKHAALIQQWLDDDSLIVERKAGDGNWCKQTDCFWNEESEYRFKPRMIKCGDLEFPEPMRKAPKIGTEYWVVCSTAYPKPFHHWVWGDATHDFVSMERGFCHATKEAAEAHAKALIALTEVKE